LAPAIEYRRGKLADLAKLRFEEGLSPSPQGIEFNVLGIGHEFWIAAESGSIIGVAVVGKENGGNIRILHLEVARTRKKEGIGSALLTAVIENYPTFSFSVTPFEGTEDFYSHLGFVPFGQWEMKREPSRH
jgi:GNAT superfamily N-acetyltransferase